MMRVPTKKTVRINTGVALNLGKIMRGSVIAGRMRAAMRSARASFPGPISWLNSGS